MKHCLLHVMLGMKISWRSLVEKTKNHFGGVDILINNAATNPVYAPIEDMSSELFDKMMSINVKAAFTLSNLCLPFMKQKDSGIRHSY